MGGGTRIRLIGVATIGAVLACFSGTASAGVLNDAVKAFDLPDAGQFPVNAPNGRSNLTAAGGTLYYTAFGFPQGSSVGNELYGSDGTAAGTRLISEINPGGSSFPDDLTAVGNRLFFTADDGVHGRELWVTDGTTAGTKIVEDINPNGSSTPTTLTAVGDKLFFTANDGSTGIELYTADAAGGGANLIDIVDGPLSSNPIELARVGDLLYFSAYTDATGFELYTSNGTAAGTQIVTDLKPGVEFAGGSNPEGITDVGGIAYFRADDGTKGVELYKSNAAGTFASRVADINPDGGNSNPVEITAVGNTAYFKANDGTHGFELWKSDGTPATTSLVEDIRDPGSSNPTSLTNVGGTLFFSADASGTGKELWKSDGTPATTDIVENINPAVPANGEATPTELTSFGGKLYFYANDGVSGFEPWTSDGTEDGTFRLRDTNPGSANGLDQSTLVPFRGSIFYDAANGTQIWKLADTIAPAVTIDSGPADGATITSATDTFGFSSNDLPATFGCRVYPTGSTPPAFGACSGAGTHTPPALSNGAYTFEVQGFDIGGNVSATASRSFTVAIPPSDPGPIGPGPVGPDPVDPGPSARCLSAKADLEKAVGKLAKAKAKLKKAKESGKSAKVKSAKKKVKTAKSQVKAADSAVADAC